MGVHCHSESSSLLYDIAAKNLPTIELLTCFPADRPASQLVTPHPYLATSCFFFKFVEVRYPVIVNFGTLNYILWTVDLKPKVFNGRGRLWKVGSLWTVLLHRSSGCKFKRWRISSGTRSGWCGRTASRTALATSRWELLRVRVWTDPDTAFEIGPPESRLIELLLCFWN